MQSIFDIRKALGISQTEMADRLGVRQSTISRIEKGIIPTNTRTMLAARALLPVRRGKAA